jgi:hypothetical protein
MVYMKFILLKFGGNLSNLHGVGQISMKFPVFVEMLWKYYANWTSFNHVHQGFHSGNHTTSTSEIICWIILAIPL